MYLRTESQNAWIKKSIKLKVKIEVLIIIIGYFNTFNKVIQIIQSIYSLEWNLKSITEGNLGISYMEIKQNTPK